MMRWFFLKSVNKSSYGSSKHTISLSLFVTRNRLLIKHLLKIIKLSPSHLRMMIFFKSALKNTYASPEMGDSGVLSAMAWNSVSTLAFPLTGNV